MINKTALHYAVESWNKEVVKYILAIPQVDVNAVTIFNFYF